ncbi:TIGR04211 family SH3 domain-containing protein [Paraglaciecola aquimarina]|uniref:TIGR04211 family SH3 domain-containing protein n=1 Tax=Paraglaciecola aquimarina TaxID=1235557 RepID=A0ABU3SVC6_9ALTE|nr:TIGR04211 family SH3 domain-containing protein [Paraglaciecola aquimarina]MDU0353961.1 TIGR04211 family SH3 domain-containing protein [Paraglaciecola aquimarina]
MRKQIVFLCLLVGNCLFSGSLIAQETTSVEGEARYISDDLYTYLHAGPSRNYRILGSVTAGTKVTLIQEDKDNNFSEVVDDKQRKGWIQSDFINVDKSVRELVPGLKEQVQQTQLALQAEQTNTDLLNQQIRNLTAEVAQLKQSLTESEKTTAEVTETLNNYDKNADIEWATRGGIFGVACIILGILITYLPKKRRKNDNWM